ncbi:MAG: ABC transporter substrate-binding protein [Firmicutes bacterium]|nr:ABC transporter substrate-binding protein [Bacillota bacterium]
MAPSQRVSFIAISCVIALIIGVTSLSFAASKVYQEAPMLTELVKQGKLPSVEKRLPDDPMVVTPVNEIGQYGGTWRRAALSPVDTMLHVRLGYEPLIRWDRDGKRLIPNVATSWDISDGGKTFTLHLRKGIKWSDGEPMTADDIAFWYEDVICNKELTPVYPDWLLVDGKPARFEKVDAYTIRFSFAKPHSMFLEYLASPDAGPSVFNYPKHYLKQFHPKYAQKAQLDAKVKSAKFDNWYQLFADRAQPFTNPELPSIRPWILKSNPTATRLIAERNPYYWKVDTKGNQLPYIDRIAWDVVQDVQMITMKAVSGEIDMQARNLSFSDYPLLMENRDKGGYEVYLWNAGQGASAIFPNQNFQGDQVIRGLIRNVKFRKALSMAINRDEVNELNYLGQATPAYTAFPYDSLQNDPGIRKLFEYNPKEANKLLDELGLNKRDKDGYRLRPDGKPLTLTIMTNLGYSIHADVMQAIQRYWSAVGIRTVLDTVSGALWWERIDANNYQFAGYTMEFGTDYYVPSYSLISLVPKQGRVYWAPLYGRWYITGGKEGEKPTGAVLQIIEDYRKLLVSASEKERDKLTEDIFRLWAENLYGIPVLGGYNMPVVVKKNFENVPRKGNLAYAYSSPGYLMPEQFFIKQK